MTKKKKELKGLVFPPEKFSCAFIYLALLFIVCLLLSNILAAKILKVGPFPISAGILVFPISYIINDILSEVYGYSSAKRIILCGFILNLFMVLIFELAIFLPSPDWFVRAEAFKVILGSTPRFVLASLSAYLVGSLINAKVLTRMKAVKSSSFAKRAIISTIFGELADSLFFVSIAFWGAIPLAKVFCMIGIQVFSKTLYEIICLPMTTIMVRKIQQLEHI